MKYQTASVIKWKCIYSGSGTEKSGDEDLFLSPQSAAVS